MIISIFMRLLVLSFYALLFIGVLTQLTNNIKQPDKPNPSKQGEIIRESNINLIFILIILVFQAIITQIKCDYEICYDPKILVVIVMAGVPIGLVIQFIFAQLIQKIRGVEKKRRWGLRSEKDELTDREKRIIDFQRKFFHVLMFTAILGGLLLADDLLKRLILENPGDSYYLDKLESFWGSTDPLIYLSNIFKLEPFSVSRGVIVLAMNGASIVILTIEITRLSSKYHFPWHKTVQRKLRKSELDTFASYTHFMMGYTFAAVLLPSLLWLAVLSIISFGDAAASIIGIRFGKHKFKHNNKSWEGTIAGCFCSFLPVYCLVGPYYAIAAAITFAIIDIFTPTPIKASDNMLIPIITTVVFVIIGLLGVPVINILDIGFVG